MLTIKSTERLSIFELLWYWYLLLPKRRMFTKSLSVSLIISLSIDLILFMNDCLCKEKWWQCRKKWTLFSTFKLHKQSWLIVFKVMIKFMIVKMTQSYRRRVNNFNPAGLCIPYVSLHLGLIKFNILFRTLSTIPMTVWYFLNRSTHSQYTEKSNF